MTQPPFSSLDPFAYSHTRRAPAGGKIRPGEFASETVLIAGGDVGAGSVSARLVAQGGGLPVIARCSRGDEAFRLRDEIRSDGADCVVLRSDPMGPGQLFHELEHRRLRPTQLYHFMSAGPFHEPSSDDSRALYEHFARVYIDAFVALALGCRARNDERLGLFYASSTAVSDEGSRLREYVGALAAGEELCWDFAGADPSICSVVCRLPRIVEDPTSPPVGGDARPAEEVISAPLRALRRSRVGLMLADCIEPTPRPGRHIQIARP